MDGMQHFKETYITECFELLEDMESRLLSLDDKNADLEELNAIFRCAHSIKGGAGAFGFDQITDITHVLETLLDKMREGELSPNPDIIDALLHSVDIVTQLVVAAQQGEAKPVDFCDAVKEELINAAGADKSQFGGGEKSEESIKDEEKDDVTLYNISFAPHDNLFMSGNEPLLIIRELKDLGDVVVNASFEGLPKFDKLKHDKCYLKWNLELETEKTEADVKEVFEFVEDECDLKIEVVAGFSKAEKPKNAGAGTEVQKEEVSNEQAASPVQEQNADQAAEKKGPAVTTIRVDLDKVDRLVNMVGELVITQSMLAAQAKNLSPEQHQKLLSGIEELSQHSRELQESVMSVRMQPVKSIFSRMPRIVRDLSKQLGKDIRLETFGETTEVDKTVIEQLSDPLTHMIRNSVDHGIDTPENRVKNGKPAQGVIRLSAEHRGGKIVIEITDDGRGINHEKVLQKAIERGVVAAGSNLTEDEVANLIFMPGFSTADVVSDVSGRGVGMDVVKRNIENLGGTVTVKSNQESGSRFTIALPLTLAILDGMIVRVGQEQYIIPIANILETLRPKKEEIRKIANGNDLINVRGEFISIVYLSRQFKVNDAIEDLTNALVVLVENGLEKFGIVVDELIGQQQVVIKTLEENSDPVEGVSGATILGDGKVSLILDIAGLCGIANADMQEAKQLMKLTA